MILTILTPTYNREYTLERLYNSLVKQEDKDFLWYIIDDGSSDNTKIKVEEFIKDNKIKIKYDYKPNGGKHRALNYAIKKINTELTFIVDSDDWLENNAVSIIKQYHKKYKNNEKICGYSFLRKYPNGEINDKKFPRNELIGNYIDVRINGKIGGDKAEVFLTKCLLEFLFPEFENEKFLGEDVVWFDMALKYDMVHINSSIYISDYLQDGLTKNRRKNNINSPIGCMERAKRLMNNKCNILTRIKGILSYIVYGKFANKKYKELYDDFEQTKIFFIMLFPIGKIIYLKWRNKVNEKN